MGWFVRVMMVLVVIRMMRITARSMFVIQLHMLMFIMGRRGRMVLFPIVLMVVTMELTSHPVLGSHRLIFSFC